MDRREFLSAAALAPFAGSAPDWRALDKTLKGRLVRPGDASYATAKRVFNVAFDNAAPRAVAYCATAADVAACVGFARRNGLAVHPRSGGHSYAGWSTGPGLIVDVSQLKSVRHTGGLATVGSGAKLIDVYSTLAKSGVSIPAGSCPTVGVAGLTLGGGIGVVSRRYGLTIDVLRSVSLVTAAGKLITASANSHPDLFWALRGGGGGNFGIATSFTYQTHPIQDVTVFTMSWPWSQAFNVVKKWQKWAPAAPDALWANLHLSQDPGRSVRVTGLYLGSRSRCEALLKGFTAPTRTVRTMGYLQAMYFMAGCTNSASCHNGPRDRFSASSHFAYTGMSDSTIRALIAQVERPGRHIVLIDALRGAVGRVAPGATAFPHRNALFSVQYYAHFENASPWVRSARDSMTPRLGAHAYINYPDVGINDYKDQYWGSNAARLAQVKKTYDPTGFFRHPQGV
ncbi:FAD-binding oxidoreductase [Herbidospora sp. RD11066]